MKATFRSRATSWVSAQALIFIVSIASLQGDFAVISSAPSLSTTALANVAARVILVPSQEAPTIQRALELAQPGDVIDVDARYYSTDGQQSKYLPDGLTATGMDEPLPIDIRDKANVTLVSTNGKAVIEGKPMTDVLLVNHSEGFTLEGFEIRNGTRGIAVYASPRLTIKDNLILNNVEFGLVFENVTNSQIINNRVANTKGYAILLVASADNSVIGNTVVNNKQVGITIATSPKTTLINNTVSDNGGGIDIYDGSNDALVQGNTISNSKKPSGLNLYRVSNALVERNEITNNVEWGLLLDEATQSTVIGNNINKNENAGIHLHKSSGNQISQNTLVANHDNGILLFQSANNQILGNNIYATKPIKVRPDSQEATHDIVLVNSDENVVAENVLGVIAQNSSTVNARNNPAPATFTFPWNLGPTRFIRTLPEPYLRHAITIAESNRNTIVDNQIGARTRGVVLDTANENTVQRNVFVQTVTEGIHLNNSKRNLISHQVTSGASIHDVAILLIKGSDENRIENSEIRHFYFMGIRIDDSHGNVLKSNQISCSFPYPVGLGVFIVYSENTQLEGNNFGNLDVGLFVSRSDTTTLRDNTFEGNKANVVVDNYINELLVKFKTNVSQQRIDAIIKGQGAEVIRFFRAFNIYYMQAATNLRILQIVDTLNAMSEVEFAEVNGQWNLNGHAPVHPSDQGFGMQWNLINQGQPHPLGSGGSRPGKSGVDIGIARAWEQGINDSSQVYVAVVDTGIELDHPDLQGNISEYGFNALSSNATPLDDVGHGTFVAGIIGGVGNNEMGISGISWKASLIPVKISKSTPGGFEALAEFLRTLFNYIGGTTWADALNGLDYVWRLKAEDGVNLRVVNFSIGGPDFSESLALAMRQLNDVGILFVTAAGNNGLNNDQTPIYPCSYDSPNIICVAASNDQDQLWPSSNYGAQSVDLAAPGQDVLGAALIGSQADVAFRNAGTARLMSGVGVQSGTSFAAPHVTGVAALLMAACPLLSHVQIKDLILSRVQLVPDLKDKVSSGGRLNWPQTLPAACSAQ